MDSLALISASDITIRRATASDYEGIMDISRGLYGGRDIIPAVYHEYLKDPNKVFYVALLRGKVVSFAAGRVVDNGETYEDKSGRTDSKLRGTGLNLHRIMLAKLLLDDVLPRWPQLKRIRAVTIGVKHVMNRKWELQILPYGFRTAVDIIWKKPIDEYIKAIQHIQSQLSFSKLPLNDVAIARKRDLETLFYQPTTIKHLFPNGILVRDSQTFIVDPRYISNIPLILGEKLHTMFASGNATKTSFRAFSFGTTVESDISKDKMRYCIDYHGDADMNIIKSHMLKHLLEIPECLKKSSTATSVVCFIYFPNHVFECLESDEIKRFVFELSLGKIQSPGRPTVQCIVDIMQHPRAMALNHSKL